MSGITDEEGEALCKLAIGALVFLGVVLLTLLFFAPSGITIPN